MSSGDEARTFAALRKVENAAKRDMLSIVEPAMRIYEEEERMAQSVRDSAVAAAEERHKAAIASIAEKLGTAVASEKMRLDESVRGREEERDRSAESAKNRFYDAKWSGVSEDEVSAARERRDAAIARATDECRIATEEARKKYDDVTAPARMEYDTAMLDAKTLYEEMMARVKTVYAERIAAAQRRYRDVTDPALIRYYGRVGPAQREYEEALKFRTPWERKKDRESQLDWGEEE